MAKPIQGLFFRDIYNDYIAHIIKEIYFDRVYDRLIGDKKDMTVLDIGANVGLFSYYIAPKASRVIAIEPSALHFETLSKMVEFNGLGNVAPLKAAIAGQTGTSTFYHNSNTTMFSLKPDVNSLPDEAEEVDTLSMDELFKTCGIEHVDLLKLDVEGSEMDIIASAGFAAVADKIDMIIGEYHTWSNINPLQFKNALTDLGFEFEWLNSTEASMFVAQRNK